MPLLLIILLPWPKESCPRPHIEYYRLPQRSAVLGQPSVRFFHASRDPFRLEFLSPVGNLRGGSRPRQYHSPSSRHRSQREGNTRLSSDYRCSSTAAGDGATDRAPHLSCSLPCGRVDSTCSPSG